MGTPLLSVVIAVYNKEQYLEETLKSVVNQTFTDSEIILVDDGSTDSSPAICEQFANTYPRVKVIHQKNAGASAARNRGIREAVGKFLVIVDADDKIEPCMHEELVRAVQKHQCDLACSFFRISMIFIVSIR